MKLKEEQKNESGFSIDQLMELAGLSVASSVQDFVGYSDAQTNKRILLFCGPGNNGGDGLVAARHLKHFSYDPVVVFPAKNKENQSTLFKNLLQQLRDLDISVHEGMPTSSPAAFACVVDSLFGFSFAGPAVREPYLSLIQSMKSMQREKGIPILSVDIPSGWSVDEGDVYSTGFVPDAVVSLTLPKTCMRSFAGVHYIGGRFIPGTVARQFDIALPDFGKNANQIVRLVDKGLCSNKNNDNNEDRKLLSYNEGTGTVVLFATAASQEQAESIATELLKEKLAACVNMVSSVVSMYEWEGKIERSEEVLLIIKSSSGLVEETSRKIKELHSYSVPETIALQIIGGSKDYIEWVKSSTK